MFYSEGSYRKTRVLLLRWFNTCSPPPPEHHSPALSLPQSRVGGHLRGEHGLSLRWWGELRAAVNTVELRVSLQCFPSPRMRRQPAAAVHLTPLQDPVRCVMRIRVQELTCCCQEVMVSVCPNATMLTLYSFVFLWLGASDCVFTGSVVCFFIFRTFTLVLKLWRTLVHFYDDPAAVKWDKR